MSRLVLNKGAQPSAPAAGKLALFADTPDGRVKSLDATGVLSPLGDSRLPNFVRNGGFWFAQRQAPGTLTTYGATTARAIFGADGWSGCVENASAQYIRTDTTGAPESGLQSTAYGQFTKITSAGKLFIGQILESRDATTLRGRTVRVQIWAKFIGGNAGYRLGLLQLTAAGTVDVIPSTAGNFITAFNGASADPTMGAALSRIAPRAGVTGDNCTLNGNAYDVTLTGAWQRFGGVFDVPSDCKNLIVAIWSNTQVTATQGIALSQVSLTDGYELQDWSPQTQAIELNRAQRYYAKTFGVDVNPVQNAGVATGCLRCILGKAVATALAAQFQWRFPVNMRVTPTTLTTYNPAALNAQVRQIGGTAADLTATATANATEASVDITATGAAAGAVGDQCGVHVSADAEL